MGLVMLNTNRDHPSTTMELGELQDEARKIFSCLVGMGRAVVCKQVAEKYQLVDVVVYSEMFDEQQRKLNELLGALKTNCTLRGCSQNFYLPFCRFPKLVVLGAYSHNVGSETEGEV